MAHLQEILQFRILSIGGTPINVATLIFSTGVAVLAWIFSRLAERTAIRFLEKRDMQDAGSAGATARLIHYVILGVGLSVAVHTLGINLTALFAAGAVFAIGLSFAMQNITQNFVAGLILLTERTIKPGDILEIEGRMVKVTQLGMRATVTRTWDAEDYIIPNSVLVSSTVKNFTLRDRQHRLRCPVGVSYDSDMRRVCAVLEETASAIEWREPDMEPVVLLKEFGSSSVNFEVSVWVKDPFKRAISQSKLNKAVWFGLKEAGITIAYPQLDLHLDHEDVQALRGAAG
jgi:small-conductance mechanosensitive channel